MRYKIKLTETERLIVKTIKLHYPQIHEKYNGQSWHDIMIGIFPAFYVRTMSKDSFQDNFLIFRVLFEIFTKISESRESETMLVFKEAFNLVSFRRGEPIEKAIGELCGIIQATSVKDRFSLKVKKSIQKNFLNNFK